MRAMEETTRAVPSAPTMKNVAFIALTLTLIPQVFWSLTQLFGGTPLNDLVRPFIFTGAFLAVLVTRGNVRFINRLARVVVAGAFMLALSSRFENFSGFIAYTGRVNSFLPTAIIPTIAVLATIAEVLCCAAMLLGIGGWLAPAASGVLLTMFATAMTISGMSQFDWAVFVLAAGSLTLATVDTSLFSLDSVFMKNRKG